MIITIVYQATRYRRCANVTPTVFSRLSKNFLMLYQYFTIFSNTSVNPNIKTNVSNAKRYSKSNQY
jgi:hypothetical protein